MFAMLRSYAVWICLRWTFWSKAESLMRNCLNSFNFTLAMHTVQKKLAWNNCTAVCYEFVTEVNCLTTQMILSKDVGAYKTRYNHPSLASQFCEIFRNIFQTDWITFWKLDLSWYEEFVKVIRVCQGVQIICQNMKGFSRYMIGFVKVW